MEKPYNPWGKSVDDFDRGVAHCVDRAGRFGIFGAFIVGLSALYFAVFMDLVFSIDVFQYGYFLGAVLIGWLLGCIVIVFGVNYTRDPLR